jgi:hypothetical protein
MQNKLCLSRGLGILAISLIWLCPMVKCCKQNEKHVKNANISNGNVKADSTKNTMLSEISCGLDPREMMIFYSKLLENGSLKDGMNLDQVGKIIGRPTSIEKDYVEWYYNPEDWHVYPGLRATLRNSLLYDFKIIRE